jgi:membrane-bound inhibitor of C-type lysozyme
MNGNTGSGSMNPQTQTATCRASTSPATFYYQVNGNVATLTSNGQTAMLAEVSSANGARPIYGVWEVPIPENPAAQAAGLSINATLEVAADHVTVTSNCSLKGKSVKAVATSTATVTDNTVTIDQSEQDVETITYP